MYYSVLSKLNTLFTYLCLYLLLSFLKVETMVDCLHIQTLACLAHNTQSKICGLNRFSFSDWVAIFTEYLLMCQALSLALGIYQWTSKFLAIKNGNISVIHAIKKKSVKGNDSVALDTVVMKFFLRKWIKQRYEWRESGRKHSRWREQLGVLRTGKMAAGLECSHWGREVRGDGGKQPGTRSQ